MGGWFGRYDITADERVNKKGPRIGVPLSNLCVLLSGGECRSASVHHRDTARLRPQPKEVMTALFNEPAKLADRSVAPGEASEPGERVTKKLRAPKGATDGCAARNHHDFAIPVTNHLSPASQALLDFVIVTPGSAASPGATLRSACSAGSSNAFLQLCFSRLTLSEKQELTDLLQRFVSNAMALNSEPTHYRVVVLTSSVNYASRS